MAAKPVTPKGLVLDLVATLRTGSMPARALVAAGEVFGIDENRMRVAIARAFAEGLIERDQRGEYRRRADRGLSVLVAGWRGLEHRMSRWRGDWIAALFPSRSGPERGAKRRSARALRVFGFRPFQPGVALRPANLVDTLPALHARLADLGLRPEFSIGLLQSLDEAADRRARALWDTETLRRGYSRSIAKVEQSRRQLPGLPVEKAMAESFTLGGSIIRQLVLDPLLPPPLVPAGELAALVRAMRAYETAGRAVWRGFLQRHGVDFAHAPADLAAHGPTPTMEGSLGGYA
jgi:phenylacetic acid degradation operon negative regulatory protein